MFPIIIPADARKVEDADEEIFLLYTQLQAERARSTHDPGGLGSVDTRKSELVVRIDITASSAQVASSSSATTAEANDGEAPRRSRKKTAKGKEKASDESVEITLFQDTTALRSRPGETGSVLWRASVNLASVLLSQHRFPPSSGTGSPFIPADSLAKSHNLELGAGTGLLSIALAPHVARYTATDRAPLLPLIRKNHAHNLAPAAAAELDWEQLHALPPLPPPPPDLVLAVDCIYNPALVAPLLSAIAHVAGRAPVLVVLELRAEDVAREFLDGWLASPGAWEVWSVPALLGPRFAAWVGKRTAPAE